MTELVPPRGGKAWQVGAGDLVRVVDVEGGQSGDVFAVAADDPHDGLSNGRTFDYGGTIRLSTGSTLYSRRSRPLLTIVDDEVGVHDFLFAPCSQEMFEICHGATGPHPNCFDNLSTSLGAFGVPASTVTIAFNVFFNVAVGADGRLEIRPPVSTAGQGVTFVAERDVLVAVASCSAASGGSGGARPLGVEISAGG